MQTEYEAMFIHINKEVIRQKLLSCQATLVRPEFFQKRQEFNLPIENSEGKWARVRDEGDTITMSFKQITSGGVAITDQKEINLVVDDYEKAQQFLTAIGCAPQGYRENYRELWKLNGAEVTIDTWPWLEPLVEVEGSSEQQVREVSEILGFDWSEALFNSIDAVYARVYGVDAEMVCQLRDGSFAAPNPFLN